MLPTLWVSVTTMLLTTVAAMAIAMALHQSRMKGKWLVRGVLMLPLLAPSLVQGLGLIFLFGRNGLVHKLTGICPTVALHIPRDTCADWSAAKTMAA